MSHSTRALSDSQFLRALRHRFSTARLRQAVAARRAPTRDRAVPHWVLLAALVGWFWVPTDKLPWVLRWLRLTRVAPPSDPAVSQARGRLGWAPLLLTSLLNPEPNPAEQVVRLYHARWEQELALSEVKGQLSGRVTQVRACDPVRAAVPTGVQHHP